MFCKIFMIVYCCCVFLKPLQGNSVAPIGIIHGINFAFLYIFLQYGKFLLLKLLHSQKIQRTEDDPDGED